MGKEDTRNPNLDPASTPDPPRHEDPEASPEAVAPPLLQRELTATFDLGVLQRPRAEVEGLRRRVFPMQNYSVSYFWMILRISTGFTVIYNE